MKLLLGDHSLVCQLLARFCNILFLETFAYVLHCRLVALYTWSLDDLSYYAVASLLT